MLFRFIIAPLLFTAGGISFIFGVVTFYRHIWYPVEAAGSRSPLEAMLCLFFAIGLIGSACMFYIHNDFEKLSRMLRGFIPLEPFLPAPPKPATGKEDESAPLSTKRAPSAATEPFVFVSYSHMDDQWRHVVVKWLKPSLKECGWDLWADDRLAPGYEWNKQLAWAIEHSHVAVCLVSADFVSSDFIRDTELPALRGRPRHAEYGIDWIPISTAIVRPVSLHNIEALWPPKKPVSTIKDKDERDLALQEIVERLLAKIARGALAPDPPIPSR